MLPSTALPEEGRRMAMGSGCSDCYRGRSDLRVQGVPAQGPGQAIATTQIRRVTGLDEFAKSFIVEISIHERNAQLSLCYFC